MTTYNTTADSSGNWSITFGTTYSSAQKTTVVATKDALTDSVVLYAPSSTVNLDETALRNKIAEALAINQTTYTSATVAVLQNAIDNAVDALGTTQPTIDSALVTLQNAINGLVVAPVVSSFGLLFSGDTTNYPTNIGGITLSGVSGAIAANSHSSSITGSAYSLATSLTIPNGVTSIGSSAFANWSAATSLTIPNGVTSIGSSAFASWTSATSLTIPNSVGTISASSFQAWSAATSLTIGSGVTSIGASCFAGWAQASLVVTMVGTTPPTITSTSITSWASTAVIRVPSSALTTYQTATNWSARASQMVGY